MFTSKRITLLGTAGLAALVLLLTLITGVFAQGTTTPTPATPRRMMPMGTPGTHMRSAGTITGTMPMSGTMPGIHGMAAMTSTMPMNAMGGMCDMMQTMMKGMMGSAGAMTSTMPMTGTGEMCGMMQTMMKNMMPGMMASMMSGQGMMSAGQRGMPGMMGMMGGNGGMPGMMDPQGMMPGKMMGQGGMPGMLDGQGMMPGGMMRRGGMPGMMGGGMMGMMGADDGEPGVDPGPAPKRLTAAEVAKAVDVYLAQNYSNPDLEVVELMEFEKNFYAQVAEKSTEINAFELLIDPYTGVVWPEYGPNMMWNTKYGHMDGMGGMMAQGWAAEAFGQPTADMPVGLEQARKNAQAYLDYRKSGLTIEEDTDVFYGYYTVHTLDKDGNTVGMLSVNGYTGRVWYHTWHGKFVGMVDGM
jgi:hypothetical protein